MSSQAENLSADSLAPADWLTGEAPVSNKVGLHARPVVKLTKMAKARAAKIEIRTRPDGPWIDAKSPVKMMNLKAVTGTPLYIRALGADADAAIAEILDFINRKFDEE